MAPAFFFLDFDNEDEVARMPAAALTLAMDFAAAKTKAEKARAFVNQCFTESMCVLKKICLHEAPRLQIRRTAATSSPSCAPVLGAMVQAQPKRALHAELALRRQRRAEVR